MLELVQQHRAQVAELCCRYGVKRLDLFGSAARGEFDPAKSDLDFLVVFDKTSGVSPADRFLGLMTDLEHLFGRRVDLVEVAAHRNPYFMADALKHRVMLYAA